MSGKAKVAASPEKNAELIHELQVELENVDSRFREFSVGLFRLVYLSFDSDRIVMEDFLDAFESEEEDTKAS